METLPAKNKGGRPKGATKYSKDRIDEALLAYAFTGQFKEASEQMALIGVNVPAGTIGRWAREYPGRLAELHEQHRDEIERLVVSEYSQALRKAVNVTLEAVKLAEKDIAAGKVRDAASTARNLATTAAIFQDKIHAIQGRPTKIIQHRSEEEALRSLAQRHGLAVEATAEDDT